MQPVNNVPIAIPAPLHEQVPRAPSLVTLCLRTLRDAANSKEPSPKKAMLLAKYATESEEVKRALFSKEYDLFLLFNKSPDDCFNFIFSVIRNDPHSLLQYGAIDRAPFLHAAIAYFAKCDRNDLLLLTLQQMKERSVITAAHITAVATEALEQKTEKRPSKNLLEMLLRQIDTAGQNVLQLALKTASPDVVRYLLTMLPKDALETADPQGKTPLMFALENKNYHSLLLFPELDIASKLTRQDLDTLLASQNHKNAESVISKLTKEQLHSTEPESKKTILHIAAKSGCPKTFACLLKLCGDIHNARDKDGQTALEIALINKQFGKAHLLISALSKEMLSEKDPVTGSTALHHAAAHASPSILQAIMKKCPILHTVRNNRWQLPFDYASELENIEAVSVLITKLTHKELLEFRCAEHRSNSIHYLISLNLIKPLEEILLRCPEIRNDRNMNGFTPLEMALVEKKYDLAKLLITHLSEDELAVEDSKHRRNIFHFVSEWAVPEEILMLLIQKCPKGLAKQNRSGLTPVNEAIHLYAYQVALHIIKALTAEQLNSLLPTTSNFGTTVLHNAVYNKAPKEIYQALLKKCPSMLLEKNAADKTAFESAVTNKDIKEEHRYFAARSFIELLTGEEILQSVAPEYLSSIITMTIDHLPADTLTQLITKVPSILKVKVNVDQTRIEYAITQTKIAQAKILINSSPQKLLEKINPETGNSLLHIAIDSRSEEILELLLPKIPQLVNKYNHANQTPLVRALAMALSLRATTLLTKCLSPDQLSEVDPNSGYGLIHTGINLEVSEEILSYLIKICPSMIHSRDIRGRTPLELSVIKRNNRAIKILLDVLESKQLLEKKQTNGHTVLHTAVYNEAVEWIPLLIAKCPELVSTKNRAGKIPLEVALLEDKTKAAEALIEAITEEEARKEFCGSPTLVHYAVKHYEIDALQQLLKKFPKLANIADKQGDTLLAYSIIYKDHDSAKLLIDMLSEEQLQQNLNDVGYTIAHKAAMSGSPEIIEALFTKVPKLFKRRTADGDSPLDIALRSSIDERASAILSKIKSQRLRELHPKTQISAIHLSAAKSSKKVFKKVLDLAGEVPYFRDGGNNTPLFSAVQAGNTPNVKILLKKLSVLHREQHHPRTGATVLHYAVALSSSRICKLILEKYSSEFASRRSKADETALHVAIRMKKVDNSLALIEKLTPEQLEEQDVLTRNTVAHLAVSMSAPLVLIQLLNKCERLAFSKNLEGKTPLSLAVESNNIEALTIFLNSFLKTKEEAKALTLIEIIYPKLITKVETLLRDIHFIDLLTHASLEIQKKVIEKYPELLFAIIESSALVLDRSLPFFKSLINCYSKEQLAKITYKGKSIEEFSAGTINSNAFLPDIKRILGAPSLAAKAVEVEPLAKYKMLGYESMPEFKSVISSIANLLKDERDRETALELLSSGDINCNTAKKMLLQNLELFWNIHAIMIIASYMKLELMSFDEVISLIEISSQADLATMASKECIQMVVEKKISKSDLFELSATELENRMNNVDK